MTAPNKGLTAERLLAISDEVGRIASTLARLSTQPISSSSVLPSGEDEGVPEVSVATVRTVIRARQLRARYFEAELFADPAWDMMLDLLEAELSHRRVAVSSLCVAAAVPATTALRWIKTMVEKGVFVRHSDPLDGRRIFIELSPEASVAMRRYFGQVAAPAGI